MISISVSVLANLVCVVGQGSGSLATPSDAANLIEARRLVVEASTALADKDCAKAAGLYVKAVDAGATSATTSYNVACCFALQGRADDTFKYLDFAVEMGWTDVDKLNEDPDFESLRKDDRWSGVSARCAARRNELRKSPGNVELLDELMRRMEIDQAARNADPIRIEAMAKIDADNTAWMKTVLDKHGWPGFSLVGEQGAQAAWLLVQHAAADVPFQRHCLDLLTTAFEKGDVSASDVAYLTDRVRVLEGKPQRYGTQFGTFDGELRPFPIEQEAEVDQRRAQMGLEPLAVYAERMRSLDKK